MREVGIASDSGIDLPEEVLRELDIAVAPVTAIVDGEEFPLTKNIDRAAMIDRLAAGSKFSSSGANVGGYQEAYVELLGRAKSIVAFGIAARLSTTYSCAIAAAELIDGEQIKVIDSHNIYIGQAPLVVASARRAASGASYDEVVAFAEKAAAQSFGMVISPNNALIKAIGRVTEGRDENGREMRLAIMRLAEDKVVPFDAASDYEEAVERVVAQARQLVPEGREICVVVTHARQPEAAELLRRRIGESIACRDIVSFADSSIGVIFGGIGAVALGICPA